MKNYEIRVLFDASGEELTRCNASGFCGMDAFETAVGFGLITLTIGLVYKIACINSETGLTTVFNAGQAITN